MAMAAVTFGEPVTAPTPTIAAAAALDAVLLVCMLIRHQE